MFELAFDMNSTLYPALFNTYSCGWGVTQTETEKVKLHTRTDSMKTTFQKISENMLEGEVIR